MKKSILIIISILLIAIFFRTFFINDTYFGEDAYYHHAVVKQSLEKGQLTNDNDLEYCYEGIKGGHPIGYYFFHYYFAKLFGLETVFYFLPLVFGLVSMILAFFLVKKLFNERTAYFMIFFMAVSLSFVSKTLPRTFRGETIIYPLLLLGLLLSWISLNKKGTIIPVLSGIVLGLSSFFWNGYIIVLICANTAITSFIFHNYFLKKIKKEMVVYSVIILISQLITVLLIAFLFMSRHLKGFIFATKYLPLLNIILIISILVFYLTREFTLRKKFYMLSGGILLLISVGFLFKKDVINLLYGLGSIQRESVYTIVEMAGLNLRTINIYFGLLSIAFLIGFFIFFKNFSGNKAYFLGTSIPALYVAYSANRFVFFASFFVICFSSIGIDYFLNLKDKKKNIVKIFVVSFIIIILIQSINSVVYAVQDKISESSITALKYFGENTQEKSCLISPLSSVIYYYADRYSYLPSLSGEIGTRAKEYANLMLSNKIPNLSVENLFVTVEDKDIARFWTLNELVQFEGLGGSFFISQIESYNEGNYTLEEYYDAYRGEKYVLKRYKNRLEAYRKIMSLNMGGVSGSGLGEELLMITHVFDFDKEYVYDSSYDDCFYSGDYSYYLNNKTCNTLGFKMLVGKDIEGIEKWYSTPNFKIYKILPSSS